MTAPQRSTTTIPMDTEQRVLGYLINCLLSETARAAIVPLQDELERQFPGAIWHTPWTPCISLSWIGSRLLADYGGDKDALYRELAPHYVEVFQRAVRGQRPLTVTFDTIEAFPGAVIVKGRDDGSIRRIRQQFLSEITLLPGTKIQEPSFIHSTICRFLKPIDFAGIKDAIGRQAIDIEEHIPELWLTRETGFSMQEYEIIKRF